MRTYANFEVIEIVDDIVTPRFLPHGIKIVHDVYIVVKLCRGAQGQGPAIDLVFCVSMIKVDVDGYSAKSGTLHFEVIM